MQLEEEEPQGPRRQKQPGTPGVLFAPRPLWLQQHSESAFCLGHPVYSPAILFLEQKKSATHVFLDILQLRPEFVRDVHLQF